MRFKLLPASSSAQRRPGSLPPPVLTALPIALLALAAAASAPAAAAGTDPVAAPPAAAGGTSASQIPDEFKLNLLIRSIIIAVNQANQTSNYTVLRDLASPKFKSANSPQKLAEIFKDLRQTKFDLSPILFFTPKLVKPPALENGMLRLTGFFDTRPQLVVFDLLFETVDGGWRLYGIDLGTQPPSNGGAATPTAPVSPAGSK